ncbi:MAG TPA: hypothetical protein PK718_09035 [Candidatus Methanofastidiosa archaeon]|nr:hypothetical protein [Candidatus Methanofastidiosa archaeon]
MKGKILSITFILLAFALVVGTGAFTSITAERSADISVVNDSNALLSLTAVGSYSSYNANGELVIAPTAGANMNAETDYGQVFTITNNGSEDVKVTIYQYLDGNDVTLTSPLLFSKSENGNPQNMQAVWNTTVESGGSINVYMKLYTNMQDEYSCDFGKIIDSIRIVALT